MVPTKIAAGVWNYLSKYKTSIPEFPQTETCELLIVDRSVDQVHLNIHVYLSSTSRFILHVIQCY
jgi:syntaxin-binding protein 1